MIYINEILTIKEFDPHYIQLKVLYNPSPTPPPPPPPPPPQKKQFILSKDVISLHLHVYFWGTGGSNICFHLPHLWGYILHLHQYLLTIITLYYILYSIYIVTITIVTIVYILQYQLLITGQLHLLPFNFANWTSKVVAQVESLFFGLSSYCWTSIHLQFR